MSRPISYHEEPKEYLQAVSPEEFAANQEEMFGSTARVVQRIGAPLVGSSVGIATIETLGLTWQSGDMEKGVVAGVAAGVVTWIGGRILEIREKRQEKKAKETQFINANVNDAL